MKILITGAQGFVGQYFQRWYDKPGNWLTLIDVKPGGIQMDVREFFRTDHTYYDLVIHLAAVVGGRNTIEGSPLSVAVDLAIDAEMWQWALRTKPGRIVYFSSSAAYPIDLQYRDSMIKLREDHIDLANVRNPDLTYGWSKLTGEYQAQFVEAEGIKVNVFRPFSGYGTDQALDYPFPSFIKRAVDRANPFQIWGDGCQVRDFIHITDIVEAVQAAIDNDVQGPVNLGTGRPTSFNQLAVMAATRTGYQPQIEHLEAKPTGVMYRVSDPSKMLSFYKPKITLEQGINMAVSGVRHYWS